MEREQIERQIDQIRSKHTRPILKLLEHEHSMYHGELAEQLNISPSGLNAIIKKMLAAELPLIEVDQIGKFKKYSLSKEIAEHFTVFFPEQKGKRETVISGKLGLFIPIQRFIEICGDRWRENLSQLLCGEDEEYPQEIKDAFEVFIKQLQELYRNNDPGLIQLKRFIHNEAVLYLLDGYLQVD